MTITFEFLHGPHDAYTVTSDDATVGFDWANAYYKMSGEGEIGHQFMGLAPAGLNTMLKKGGEKAQAAGHKMHKYEVIERTEDGDSVRVKVKYVGPVE